MRVDKGQRNIKLWSKGSSLHDCLTNTLSRSCSSITKVPLWHKDFQASVRKMWKVTTPPSARCRRPYWASSMQTPFLLDTAWKWTFVPWRWLRTAFSNVILPDLILDNLVTFSMWITWCLSGHCWLLNNWTCGGRSRGREREAGLRCIGLLLVYWSNYYATRGQKI